MVNRLRRHATTSPRHDCRILLSRAQSVGTAASGWNSLRLPTAPDRAGWYDDDPVRRGPEWAAHVAQPQTDAELVALRRSVERGVPYGNEPWQKKTIARLGLGSTLRPRGRPRKAE